LALKEICMDPPAAPDRGMTFSVASLRPSTSDQERVGSPSDPVAPVQSTPTYPLGLEAIGSSVPARVPQPITVSKVPMSASLNLNAGTLDSAPGI
jgi:hypothetical protein